jgi:hypothetical protein
MNKRVKMKLRNIFLAVKDQGPPRRFVRNLKKGHMRGLLSARSHVNANGKPKVMYNTKPTAKKAAVSMSKKRHFYFSNYKCLYCDGYHIGKNSENKT